MRPYRSMLFVPGHKLDWIEKAGRSGADALIIDLEDAVPHADKPRAREIAREAIALTKSQGQGAWVRVSHFDTGWTPLDLVAAVREGLDGIVQPKVEGPDDVRRLAAMLEVAETVNGVAAGSVEIFPLPETAKGAWNIHEICAAHPRVGSVLGPSAAGADFAASVGYQWTREETETLYLRSRILLAARAAGLRYVLSGPWTEIRDLEGYERHCIQNRQIGYTGEMIIHPSHATIANRVYTPTPAEVARARGIIEAMAEAEARGDAAVSFEGQMIDYATLKSARDLLDLAGAIGAA